MIRDFIFARAVLASVTAGRAIDAADRHQEDEAAQQRKAEALLHETEAWQAVKNADLHSMSSDGHK